MLPFFFRLSALAIRFLCPLAALSLSDAETMGAYYLFVSYFTFVVGISALELAVPFSRKFLRCKTDQHRRLVFTGFLSNQAVVTLTLAVPAGMLVATWARVPTALIPLFCLSLASEACVNEAGRFFWNIGEWRMPSLRDLIRSVIFTTAIIGSVFSEKVVLTAMTFIVIATGNACILAWELRTWGNPRISVGRSPVHAAKTAWSRVRRSLAGSLQQFLQMQLLGLQPLLERSLLEKTEGLVAVAAFSFLNSMMQSAAGLQLVPMVAQTRQRLLGSRTVSEQIESQRQALRLSLKIATICGAWGLAVYLATPTLMYFTGKEITVSPPLLLIAYASSVSAIFCSAVAPLLTVQRLAWQVNGFTALGMGCLALGQYVDRLAHAAQLSLTLIGCIAMLQLMGRILLIRQTIINLRLRE